MIKQGTLFWITGLSGAGKTAIGTSLYYKIKETNDNVIILDGDTIKSVVTDEVDYTSDGRRKRAEKYARLCKLLTDQGMIVICCTIAMFESVRAWNRENNTHYVEIFLDVPLEVLIERDQKGLYSGYQKEEINNIVGLDLNVEFPVNPDLRIVNDGSTPINDIVKSIMEYPYWNDKSSDFDRDTSYWNSYYTKRKAPQEASHFAKWVYKEYIKEKAGKLLELGAGNGRDSAFFWENGCDVIAIDASRVAIDYLSYHYRNESNISFICDDFVKATSIYCSQFDYIYSRFSLHAIDAKQEDDLLNRVGLALKADGVFFVEVRSINDDIYGKGEKVAEDSYVYDGHFRRFLRLDNLCKKLKENGFDVIYAKEDKGFAPFGDSDPFIIRVVARPKRRYV